MNESRVFVKVDGKEARLKVVGSGTYASGQDLREFLIHRWEQGTTHFRFDLRECTSLDSTFLGILVMTAVDRQAAGVKVELANCSERVNAQIGGLGIRSFFSFSSMPPAQDAGWIPLQQASRGTNDPPAQAWTVLQAHESLGQANPENIVRFQGVVEQLRKDLGSP